MKMFVLFDGRAKAGDTDETTVFITARSETEARKDGLEYKGYDCVWYEFEVEGNILVNPIMRMDLPPNEEI